MFSSSQTSKKEFHYFCLVLSVESHEWMQACTSAYSSMQWAAWLLLQRNSESLTLLHAKLPLVTIY